MVIVYVCCYLETSVGALRLKEYILHESPLYHLYLHLYFSSYMQ